MAENPQNLLYYGDNLDVMRRHIESESIDLVYLDPPFNSNTNYNILFAEKDGSKAASQIQAFSDTWSWNQESEAVFAEIVTAGGKVSDCLQAFRTFLGECDMLAYLVMMAPRLVELKRVMKPTASIYLHCDPAACHYLRMLMDAVFGPENFLNEVIWKRTFAHGGARRYGPVHDVILFYSKTEDFYWSGVYIDYSNEYKERFFRFQDDDGRRYRLTILTGTGTRKGSSGAPWRGIDPTKIGRHWAVPGYVRKLIPNPSTETVQDALDQMDTIGRIVWPKKEGGTPALKQYINDMPGAPVQDVWGDIPPIGAQAAERLGYPTQKPVALLNRIIHSSCPPDGVVLDPFCGCGTTISAAQSLGRPWIGIDITHLAINLIKNRLKDSFGESATFKVIGEPVSVQDAERLAESDPYQFQWWALGLVGARPVEQKKGADKGIDGRIIFQGEKKGTFESVILSVKAGHTGASHVRDLKGVLEREKSAIGVLISMEHATKPMKTEAVTAGFYESALWGKKYPKIQLLTVEELLAGKKIEMPPIRQVDATFKKAPNIAQKKQEQSELDV
ncbi:MAG: site-specific DNA-methyltransferase [Deltaproteobacteria bacterium]|nr:site-specific DNA-methyltransferase [Deltaproteobacteria bacterium]